MIDVFAVSVSTITSGMGGILAGRWFALRDRRKVDGALVRVAQIADHADERKELWARVESLEADVVRLNAVIMAFQLKELEYETRCKRLEWVIEKLTNGPGGGGVGSYETPAQRAG